jgi:hypothetical protein
MPCHLADAKSVPAVIKWKFSTITKSAGNDTQMMAILCYAACRFDYALILLFT